MSSEQCAALNMAENMGVPKERRGEIAAALLETYVNWVTHHWKPSPHGPEDLVARLRAEAQQLRKTNAADAGTVEGGRDAE